MTVKLGIPSKGRLMQDTFAWFAERDVHLTRSENDREYSALLEDFPGIELHLLAAGEIPRELAAGQIHIGVTGSDVMEEKVANASKQVEALVQLGFGFANLVIAVPNTWVDVRDLGDLDAVAAQFRRVHGHRLRIATKYHRLVRMHLKAAGVAEYQLVDSQGATEGTVKNMTAEAIADITSTGATLKANHLKVIGEVIHSSQATLYLSKHAQMTSQDSATLAAFLEKLGLTANDSPGG